MRFLKKVHLHNWMSYRGKQTIELSPKAYAVVARKLGDEERSNWLGKSSLLEAIFFALTGILNPDRHQGADGWISDGEKSGSVGLEFDDGVEVTRERKRSTQLYVVKPGTTLPAKGDEAQALIAQMMGLSPDDGLVTYYFAQRKMAQLVLTESSKRMGVVSDWLRLGPLEAGEEHLRNRASELSTEIEAASTRASFTKDVEARELGSMTSLEALEEQMKEVDGKLVAARNRVGELQDALARAERYNAAQNIIVQFDAIVAAAEEVRVKLDETDGEKLEQAHKQAYAMMQTAQQTRDVANRERLQKTKLASGQFDGHCPIAEMPCPIHEEINKQHARNAKLAATANEVFNQSHVAWDMLETKWKQLDAKLQEYKRLEDRLEGYKNQAAKLTAAYEDAIDVIAKTNDPATDLRALQGAQGLVENLTAVSAAIHRSYSLIVEARREGMRHSATLLQLTEKLATVREAIAIFGKQGAQRRIAESAIAQIEHGANDMLRECNIGLSVEVRWSREGSGPAKTCDTCGHPFPSSRTIKVCERCNTARGPLLVNKMDILLSDQSGAAEDLAGAAIQLSASAWLRRARESQWSTALIDEPFGQLDAAHRRQFASHLAAMLRGRYGFEQSFVIAHHSSVLDALPGRIEIVNDGRSSQLRVLA